MTRIKLEVGTRYVLGSEIFTIQQVLDNGSYRVAKRSSGEVLTTTYEALLAEWVNGEVRFEVVSANGRRDAEADLMTAYLTDDIADLPDNIRAETWRRYHLILSLYAHYEVQSIQMLTRAQIEAYLTSAQAQAFAKPAPYQGIGRGSVENYLSAFVESGGDIRSLVPRTRLRGGKQQSRLGEDVDRIVTHILEKYASMTERESTLDQLMVEVMNAIADENQFRDISHQLIPPSQSTLRRRVKAAGEKRILGRRLSRREQKVDADTHPSRQPTRILERVEIDHTQLDFFVVDERDGLPIGRPYITACIDKYSGMIPGWHLGFQPVSYVSIMRCLRHALLPKPDYRALYGTENQYPVYGLPEKICIDNGRDFKGLSLQEALAALGIIREEMPGQTPWFKGSIERYFRSVNQRLLKGKPGYSFGSVFRLGGYDAQKDAVISLTAFLEIFHIFMVDIYPHTWHTGLEAKPIDRWQAGWNLFRPDLFEDAHTLHLLLLPSAERVLQPRGIEWEWNYYRSPALARLREFYRHERVRFKYDPDDLSTIYVRDTTSGEGWVEFHSTNPDYTQGLSLAKHRMIRQQVAATRQQIDQQSLIHAKNHIQSIIEQEFYTTRKLRRRSRLKPLVNPAASPPPSSPAPLPLSRGDLTEQPNTLSEMEGWSSDYDLPISGA